MKKYVTLFLIMLFVVLGLSITAFAADISVLKTYPDNKGSVKYAITGVTLDTTKTYQYTVVNKSDDEIAEDGWVDIADFEENSIEIQLDADGKFAGRMAKAKNGIILLKQKNADISTAEEIPVTFDVPLYKIRNVADDALKDGKFEDDTWYEAGLKLNPLYGGRLGTVNYKFVKVTNEDIIKEWLKVKKGETNTYNQLFNLIITKMTYPEDGFTQAPARVNDGGRRIIHSNLFYDRQDGFYVLYIKYSGQGYRTVNTYQIYDGRYSDGKSLSNYVGSSTTTPTSSTPTTSTPTTSTPTTSTPTTTDTTETPATTGTITTEEDEFGEPMTVLRIGFDGENDGVTTTGTTTQTDDTTTANKRIPNAGAKIEIALGIVIILGVGYISYKKYNELKNIK